MKLLQINTSINSGSTGRIAEDIGRIWMESGHESFIAAANTNQPSKSKVIKIGSAHDKYLHGLKTRVFDRHGFGSKSATKSFIHEVEIIDPDIIHLHNLHGYYLNIEVLFNYLKSVQKTVVWTFHDCWPFTGHCSYFDRINCYKWQTACNSCPNKTGYPASWLIDNSKLNYQNKKELFTGLKNLSIVTPSNWLTNHVKNSLLKEYPIYTIHNGIDLEVFNPASTETIRKKYNLQDKQIILGVASIWTARKGLDDFIEISKSLKPNQQIVLVGISAKQQKNLPTNITGILRTENIHELAAIYSLADVFVNPTYVDNFPTTNIEALACGTPVITYNTGGSPEAIDEHTGIVVEKGNINSLYLAIQQVLNNGEAHYSAVCRERAEKYFDKDDRYKDYLHLYHTILKN